MRFRCGLTANIQLTRTASPERNDTQMAPTRRQHLPKPTRKQMNAQWRREGLDLDQRAHRFRQPAAAGGIGAGGLESYRLANDLSQTDVAVEYTARYGGGVTASIVSRWEAWPDGHKPIQPGLLVVRRLAAIYQTSAANLVAAIDYPDQPGHLIQPATTRRLPAHVDSTDATWISDKLEAPAAPLNLDSDTLRRQFLQFLVATSGGALSTLPGAPEQRFAERAWIMALGQESAQFGQRINAARVDSITPEQVAQEVERLAHDFVTRPAVPLLAEAAELRSQAFGQLETHQYHDEARDLYANAARLCGLLAIASSDRFGCYDAATQHARTAWLCAEKAGHNELKAWVLGVRSTIDFWLGHHGRAAERAAQGRQYVSGGTELVRLASLEARARGRLGDEDGVQKAVDLAASARETVNQEDEASHVGIFAFPIANQVRCAGNAHMWLGNPQKLESARRELQAALDLFEAEAQQSYAHISVARVDLAIVELRLRRLDAAATTMQPVLGLPANRRLEGVVRRSGELRKQLASPHYRHTPLARELGQAVEGFCASSVTRPAR
jgi:tetratricopeptide (TPR) repeat protein